MDGAVHWNGCTLAVQFCDLSRGGAALSAQVPPAPGAAVTLRFLDFALPARVAWARGRRFGLCFHARLRATDVLVAAHRCRTGATADPPGR